MRRLLSRNAKLALSALPLFVGCALAQQGDPPLPVPNPDGEGGEATGGTTATGGTATGGTATGGTATGGTTGGTATGGTATGGTTGGTATGGTMTGGSAGSAMTGGTAGKGGSAGTSTGGSAGSAAGSAGKGGTAGSGGSGGSSAGSAGKGGSAGSASGSGGSAGGPSGELFRDNFEMGASRWMPTGSWAIATDGSMVYASTGATANSTWRAAVAGDTTWTDVQIEARVKITSFAGSSTSYYGGICARYTSNSNYACFALRSDGKIAFRVNGSNTPSVSPPGGDITEGTWYNVRVVARGANITAFLNNTEIAANSRVTTGAPATGRMAFACPGTNMVIDDVVVTTP